MITGQTIERFDTLDLWAQRQIELNIFEQELVSHGTPSRATHFCGVFYRSVSITLTNLHYTQCWNYKTRLPAHLTAQCYKTRSGNSNFLKVGFDLPTCPTDSHRLPRFLVFKFSVVVLLNATQLFHPFKYYFLALFRVFHAFKTALLRRGVAQRVCKPRGWSRRMKRKRWVVNFLKSCNWKPSYTGSKSYKFHCSSSKQKQYYSFKSLPSGSSAGCDGPRAAGESARAEGRPRQAPHSRGEYLAIISVVCIFKSHGLFSLLILIKGWLSFVWFQKQHTIFE